MGLFAPRNRVGQNGKDRSAVVHTLFPTYKSMVERADGSLRLSCFTAWLSSLALYEYVIIVVAGSGRKIFLGLGLWVELVMKISYPGRDRTRSRPGSLFKFWELI